MEKIGGYNLVVIDTTKETEEGYAQKLFEELEEKTKYGKPLHVVFDNYTESEVAYDVDYHSGRKKISFGIVIDDDVINVNVTHDEKRETYTFSRTYSSPTYGHLRDVVALESGSSQIQADMSNLSYGREFLIDFTKGATYGGSEVIPRMVRLKATSMLIVPDNSIFKFMYETNGTVYFITMTVSGNNATFNTVTISKQ